MDERNWQQRSDNAAETFNMTRSLRSKQQYFETE